MPDQLSRIIHFCPKGFFGFIYLSSVSQTIAGCWMPDRQSILHWVCPHVDCICAKNADSLDLFPIGLSSLISQVLVGPLSKVGA